MRQYSKNIFFISLTLYFITINIGMGRMVLAGRHSVGGVAEAVAFFASMLGLACLYPFFARHGRKLPVRLSVLLPIAGMLFCLYGHYLRDVIFVALGIGMLWFSALLLLPGVSPGRRGIFLGLAMAAGEMAWLIVFPLMRVLFLRQIDTDVQADLHAIQAVIQVCCGLCLIATMLWRSPGSGEPAGRSSGWAAYSVLGLFFAAGVIFFVLFGLGWNLTFPRLGIFRLPPSNLDYLILFIAPLSGFLIDRTTLNAGSARRGMDAVFALLLAVVLMASAVSIAGAYGLETTEWLVRNLFFLGRQVLFLSLTVLGSRLLQGTAFFPLYGVLAYFLYFLTFLGTRLGGLIGGPPGSRVGMLFALCALFVLLLYLLRRRLSATPGLLTERGSVEASDAGPTPDLCKQRAFAAAFGLSVRETQVLGCLVRGLEMDAVGRELGVTERTARFHLTGLLKKSSTNTRQRFMQFYSVWRPEAS